MSTVGVDLGGTKTLAVLIEDGRVTARHKAATPRTGGPDAVLDAVAAAVAVVDPTSTADAIGVGVPGPVRPGTGVLPAAPNLPGWDHEVRVGERLGSLLGRPVAVGNDVNVAALAEHRLGAARGHDDVLCVFAGTGVGAGLVLGGRLRHGPRGLAGEIGHTFVAFDELLGAEVGRGELEDHAGRANLERRARLAHAAGESTLLVELAGDEPMKASLWGRATEAGDAVALRLVDAAASAIAAAMASAVALVDVELLVLGGGLAKAMGEPWRARIEQEVAERAFAGGATPVVAAELGADGGAIGAAFLVGEPT